MIQGANVLEFRGSVESKKIYECIELFLIKKNRKSEQTRIGYERDIKRFFLMVKGISNIELIKTADLDLSYEDFEQFKAEMEKIKNQDGSNKYSAKTINRNVSAVKSMLRELSKLKIVKKEDILFLEDVESIPEEDNEYDPFTEKEIECLKEMALQERNQKQIKYYLIRMAYETCLRVEALLSIKWSDFRIYDSEVKFKAIDKGNKTHRRTIGIEFYNELLCIKDDNEHVFNISTKTVNVMMVKFVKQLPEKGDRRLVFHSIRKASANYCYSLHGDILQVQELLGHESLATTQIYLKKQDFGAIGAESLKSKVGSELYKTASHDELIAAIEQLPESQKVLISLKLNQIIKNTKSLT